MFACEEALSKGLNVCLKPNLKDSLICDSSNFAECESLTYCSFNLEHPTISLKDQNTSLEDYHEYKSEKRRYLNMLRFTCAKDSEHQCPENAAGGIQSLSQLGQSVQVS